MVRQDKADPCTGVDLYPDIYLAFDQAVISEPSFEVVIHTASPVHLQATDMKQEFLDPGEYRLSSTFAFGTLSDRHYIAIIGTTAILKAIKKSAPTVKRVVITSSFAATTTSAKLSEKYTLK